MKIVINQSQKDLPCVSPCPISKLRTATCAQVEPSRSELLRERVGAGGQFRSLPIADCILPGALYGVLGGVRAGGVHRWQHSPSP